MRLFRPLLIAALLLASTVPAYADFTFFVGSNRTPTSRSLKGFALGGSGMIAFEFEFATHGEDIEEQTPALRTYLGNVIVQTPIYIAGFQPYATVGTGIFRESLETQQETAWSFNSGVGIKRTVFGPIKVRVDYRVLKLRGEPLHSTVHRVYTGFHLKFP